MPNPGTQRSDPIARRLTGVWGNPPILRLLRGGKCPILKHPPCLKLPISTLLPVCSPEVLRHCYNNARTLVPEGLVRKYGLPAQDFVSPLVHPGR